VNTKNSRGESIPEQIFPVFRDEDELQADADIGFPIYRALERSRFLLVLCSPRAVESTYVVNEISYFKSIGKSNQVLAAIIDGEPNASWDEGKRKAGIEIQLITGVESDQIRKNFLGTIEIVDGIRFSTFHMERCSAVCEHVSKVHPHCFTRYSISSS